MLMGIGLLAAIIGLIMLIIAAFRKKKLRTSLLVMLVGFVLFIVGTITGARDASNEIKQEETSKVAKDNKKATKEFNEITARGNYGLANKVELLHDSTKITGLELHCDEGLANVDSKTLQHYFSLGVQVASIFSTSKDWKLPNIQVFAGSKMIARSDYTNHATMIDSRK